MKDVHSHSPDVIATLQLARIPFRDSNNPSTLSHFSFLSYLQVVIPSTKRIFRPGNPGLHNPILPRQKIRLVLELYISRSWRRPAVVSLNSLRWSNTYNQSLPITNRDIPSCTPGSALRGHCGCTAGEFLHQETRSTFRWEARVGRYFRMLPN